MAEKQSSETIQLEEVLQDATVKNLEKSASADAGSLEVDRIKNSDESLAAEAEEEVVVTNLPAVDAIDKKTKQENSFVAKKTVAQGMMDVALITANANQLRYLIEYQRNSSTFYFVVILIAISLLLQVVVGVSLIFKGRFDLKGKSKSRKAQMINNYVVAAIFLITIINIFIASFSISPPPGTQPAAQVLSTN